MNIYFNFFEKSKKISIIYHFIYVNHTTLYRICQNDQIYKILYEN